MNKLNWVVMECFQKKFKEMHGCRIEYLQSYIDEFVWRLNKGVFSDRVAAFDLILWEISKFYEPRVG